MYVNVGSFLPTQHTNKINIEPTNTTMESTTTTINDLNQQLTTLTTKLNTKKSKLTHLNAILKPLELTQKNAVDAINIQQLDEIKKLPNPTPVVRRTIELLCRILSTSTKNNTSSKKAMDWKRDCIRQLTKTTGQDDLATRMRTFIPRTLSKHPNIVKALSTSYISPKWKQLQEPAPSIETQTTSPPRKYGRASRVSPLSIQGLASPTTSPPLKDPLLTLHNVGYANQSALNVLK